MLGIGVALISMWVNNTAATAMMYPVTLGIIGVLAERDPEGPQRFSLSPYASGLLMVTAYTSSVGGVATPIGTATNVFAIGLIRRPEYLGQSVDFLRWSMVGLPMMVLILLGVSWWMCRRSPSGALDMPALRQYLLKQRRALGSWRRGEVNTLLVFLFVVSLWLSPGILALAAGQAASDRFRQQCPEEIVALLIPILLFLLPVDWRKREFSLEVGDLSRIDWGALILFGSGLSLGSLMFKTGLANGVGEALFHLLGTSDVWAITGLGVVAGIVLSEFTGNVAAASTLLPVIFAICKQAGVDPVAPIMGTTFAASFGSALPVSTPPNAIVYGSGLIPIRRMIAAGLGMDIICAVAIWLVLRAAFALGWSPFVG
jgi:sodium-dependent dicarboxylate transporter 2/3/5